MLSGERYTAHAKIKVGVTHEGFSLAQSRRFLLRGHTVRQVFPRDARATYLPGIPEVVPL